jgi:hypothetical protein
MSRPLAALGIGPQDHRVLLLLPLVYVAWATGSMTRVERERIVELATERLLLGPGALTVLRRWLEERPSEKYFREGLTGLVALLRAPDEPTTTRDDVQQLLADAEAIAREAATPRHRAWSIDDSQRRALRELSRRLGVDSGKPWNDLLADLGAPLPAPAPRLRTRRETGGEADRGTATGTRRIRTAARLSRQETGDGDPGGGIV